MKPYQLREFLRTLSKQDKENLRALATIKTMDQLNDMLRKLIELDEDNSNSKVKMTGAAVYLRAFYEGGVV